MTAENMVPAKRSAATEGSARPSRRPCTPAYAAHERLLIGQEYPLQGLVLADGVAVDLADHRAD